MSQPTEIWISTNCEYEDNGVDHVALSVDALVAHYAGWEGVGTVTAKLHPDGDAAEIEAVFPKAIRGVTTAHTAHYFAYRYQLKDLV